MACKLLVSLDISRYSPSLPGIVRGLNNSEGLQISASLLIDDGNVIRRVLAGPIIYIQSSDRLAITRTVKQRTYQDK